MYEREKEMGRGYLRDWGLSDCYLLHNIFYLVCVCARARARACVRACIMCTRVQTHDTSDTRGPGRTFRKNPLHSVPTRSLHSVPTRIVCIQCPHVLSAFSAQHVLSVTSVRNSATTQPWKCHPPCDTTHTPAMAAPAPSTAKRPRGTDTASLDRQTGLPWTDRQGLPGQADTASLNRYGLS